MLSYLPENLYNILKNDAEYHKIVEECTNNVFSYDDVCFINSLIKYDDGDENIEKVKKITYEKIDPKYHQILDVIMNNNVRYDEKHKNDDVELQLLSMYYANNGDTSLTSEFKQRVLRFLELYGNNRDNNLSAYVHIIAYTYYIFREIYKILNNGVYEKQDLDNFLNYENESYLYLNKLLETENESVKNIMYHKRIQMLTIFFEICGHLFMREDLSLIALLEEKMNISEFKYNEFNWFKVIFNQLVFQHYVDRGLYQDSIKYFSQIYNLICFSFENKKYAIKSLNHFNKAFLDDYIFYLKHFYNFIYKHLPSIVPYFTEELNKIHILDKQFIQNNLDIEMNKKIFKMIGNVDTPYSYVWEDKNGFRFDIIDNMLKNVQK